MKIEMIDDDEMFAKVYGDGPYINVQFLEETDPRHSLQIMVTDSDIVVYNKNGKTLFEFPPKYRG